MAPREDELQTVIAGFREFFTYAYRRPLLEQQQNSSTDRGVKGPRCVSKVTFPAPPEDDARKLLFSTIKELHGNNEAHDMIPTTLVSVRAEWVAYRPGVGPKEPEPADMSEKAKYDAITKDTSDNDITIMYMLGGNHQINGPATRRGVAATLSRLTGGRCLVIQHRLAPQHAFPSQQLDVLIAYLSLLSPPPGSFHRPVPANKLVLAGDSSGALLATSLIQTLLTLRRRNTGNPLSIKFHGSTLPIHLPAGVALQSPTFDHLCASLPSWDKNWDSDLFPQFPPTTHEIDFPKDAAWPPSPRRPHATTPLSLLAHPLVSTMFARDWRGAPPMYIAIGGSEVTLDSARVVAVRAAADGVKVVWEEFERMPHTWALVWPSWPIADRCMEGWAKACLAFVSRDVVTTSGCVVRYAKGADGKRTEEAVDVQHLTEITNKQIAASYARRVEELKQAAEKQAERWAARL